MKTRERIPRRSRSGPLLAALGTGFALALPCASSAEPPRYYSYYSYDWDDDDEFDSESYAPLQPAWAQRLGPAPPPRRRSPLWLTDTLRIRRSTGLEHRSYHKWGDHPIVLRVMGPKIRRKKQLGVTVIVHF